MTEFIEVTDADYQQVFAQEKLALVDFYASWCGACRMAAPMFKRVAGEAGIPIYKVDAEKNSEIRALAEIPSLPTISVLKDGKIVGSLCTTKEDSLKEFLKSHGVNF